MIPFDADIPFDSPIFAFDGQYGVMPTQGIGVRGMPSDSIVRGGSTSPIIRGLPSAQVIRGEDS